MLSLACLGIPALAVGAEAKDAPSLQQAVAALAADYEKRSGAVVGVSAVDLPSGRAVVSVRAGELFIPASNQKLLTSAFALAKLSGDFRFTSAVYRLGGNLLVFGDGDPTVGDPVLAAAAGRSIYAELDRWSAAISKAVGAKLDGDILVCGLADAGRYRHADWPKSQHHRWYAAPVAGLNFHNNCFDVTFVRDGREVRPEVQPAGGFIRLVTGVKLGRRHIWSLLSSADDSTVTITGTIIGTVSKPVSVAVNNPPLLLGRVLADRLRRAGVTLGGKVRQVNVSDLEWPNTKPICLTRTPLAVAMTRANKRSLNMAAECIFLRAGDGTWAGSAAEMTAALVKTYGLTAGSFSVADGGGLSRRNRIAPAAMTKLLAAVAERKDARILLASLPISGIDGSMRARLAARPYRGRVLGKTGSLAGVSCLSGYVLDERGRPAVACCVFVNRAAAKPYPPRQLADKVCRLLVDRLDRRSAPAAAKVSPGPKTPRAAEQDAKLP